MRRALGILLALAAVPGEAQQLDLPRNARQTAARDSALERMAIPVAPFADGTLETRVVEGAVRRRAYRIGTTDLTPLQILGPLRNQLEASGFEVLLDCNQISCGGFDFRFAIDVLPAPNMYVNIRAYHYLSATQPDSGAFVTVLASAVDAAGYLQVIEVGESTLTAPAPVSEPDTPTEPVQDATDLEAMLFATGSAVLNSISFDVGTTTLTAGPSDELQALADLLQARPGLQVALVGHTDTQGALEANIAVSRARASAVRDRLIEAYGVDGDRVQAAGMGYLSPRASNLTAEGREANRRVEVIVVREQE
ncbi:MAG: OmpA family protein [Pseudomonadota bacterium]